MMMEVACSGGLVSKAVHLRKRLGTDGALTGLQEKEEKVRASWGWWPSGLVAALFGAHTPMCSRRGGASQGGTHRWQGDKVRQR